MLLLVSLVALSSLTCLSLSSSHPYQDIYIPAAPGLPGTDCTEYSLSYPAWKVEALGISKTATAVSSEFRVTNTASGRVSNCNSTTSSPGIWTQCSSAVHNTIASLDNLMQFMLYSNNGSWSLQLSETWLCNDLNPNHMLNFTGSSQETYNLPLECTETECTQVRPIILSASLTSPLNITPQAPLPPANHDFPGCMKASKSPQWQVTEQRWSYSDSYSFIFGPMRYKYLYFELLNKANNHTVSCFWAANLIVQKPSEAQAVSCETIDTSLMHGYNPDYKVVTYLIWDHSTKLATINQTWHCDDESPLTPYTYSATGTLDINPDAWNDSCPPLETNIPYPPGPDLIQLDQHCRFLAAGQSVSGMLESEVKRQEMDFVAKRPPSSAPYSCTATVLSDPSYQLIQFIYEESPYDTFVDLTNWTSVRIEGAPYGWPKNDDNNNYYNGDDPGLNLTTLRGRGASWKWFPYNITLVLDVDVFECHEKERDRSVFFKMTGQSVVPLIWSHPNATNPFNKRADLEAPYRFEVNIEVSVRSRS